MAGAGPAVGEVPAAEGREEAPVVARGVQRHGQHAVGAAAADLAVGPDRAEALEVAAAGPDDELADPAGRVGPGVGVLRGEALVGVVVAVEDDVRAGVVERLPERPRGRRRRPSCAGGEARVVPEGERAGRGMGGEVCAQPLLLRRAGAAAAGQREPQFELSATTCQAPTSKL